MLTRQQGGSGVIKGSANERLSGSTYSHTFAGQGDERSFIPRGRTVSLFDWGVSKVQKVALKGSRSQPLGWDSVSPGVRGQHRNARVNQRLGPGSKVRSSSPTCMSESE